MINNNNCNSSITDRVTQIYRVMLHVLYWAHIGSSVIGGIWLAWIRPDRHHRNEQVMPAELRDVP